jgi:phage protein D
MTSFLTPTGSQPRGAVKVNGELIIGWTEFELENNNFYSADTFRCHFTGGALPFDRDVPWFCSQQDMYVELFIGFPPNVASYSVADLQSFIYGQADDIDYDPVNNTIVVTGRDLTRVFIDTKTTQKWPNLTASQIATQLAVAHGLTPVVTATTTKAGKFYEIDHVNLTDDRSEWDILNYLADVEGFRVWVRGQSLYFAPAPDPTTTTPYQIVWTPGYKGGTEKANFERVNFKRALTVSRGIQVIIRSWNKKVSHGFTATYPAKVKTIQVGKSKTGAGAQIYSKTIPNLTQEQAIQRAQNWYQQLVAHEMKFDNMGIPGDNGLDITSIISLSGTGTAFDQQYFPDSISRSLNVDGGYEMTVAAKNHSPESETGAL